MKSNVPSAVAFEDLNAAGFELLPRCQNIGDLGISAKGDHRSMLQQKQNIPNPAILAHLHQRHLQPKSRGVVKGSELDDGDQFCDQGLPTTWIISPDVPLHKLKDGGVSNEGPDASPRNAARLDL